MHRSVKLVSHFGSAEAVLKDNIIRTAKNEKLSNDAKKAELDAIEDLKRKYEIETEISKPESPTENSNDNISSPETTETDTNGGIDEFSQKGHPVCVYIIVISPPSAKLVSYFYQSRLSSVHFYCPALQWQMAL